VLFTGRLSLAWIGIASTPREWLTSLVARSCFPHASDHDGWNRQFTIARIRCVVNPTDSGFPTCFTKNPFPCISNEIGCITEVLQFLLSHSGFWFSSIFFCLIVASRFRLEEPDSPVHCHLEIKECSGTELFSCSLMSIRSRHSPSLLDSSRQAAIVVRCTIAHVPTLKAIDFIFFRATTDVRHWPTGLKE